MTPYEDYDKPPVKTVKTLRLTRWSAISRRRRQTIRDNDALTESDGWDKDGNRNPSVRRIHRIFFFCGFICLIAALLAGIRYIPVKIVVDYSSGGRRVYYLDRYCYYFKGNNEESRRYRWTDTLYNADGSIIYQVDTDNLMASFCSKANMLSSDTSIDKYEYSDLFYYNENTAATSTTIKVLIDSLCDDSADYIYLFRGALEDIGRRMSENGGVDVIAALIDASRHTNRLVRRWSVWALSNCPNLTNYENITIPALIERIDDDEIIIIQFAITGLSNFKNPEWLPHIKRGYEKMKMKTNDEYNLKQMGLFYAMLLVNIGSDVTVNELKETKEDIASFAFWSFAVSTLSLETRDVVYREFLSNPSAQVSQLGWETDYGVSRLDILLRVDSVQLMACDVKNLSSDIFWTEGCMTYPETVIPFLNKCITNGNIPTQRICAKILLRMRALKSAPAILINDLSNPDEYCRYPAVVNLGRIGDPSVIPQLDSIAKNDLDKYIRRAATDALIRLRNNQ